MPEQVKRHNPRRKIMILMMMMMMMNKLTRCTIFSVYCVTTPLHVSGPLAVHHQESECVIWRMVHVSLLSRLSACPPTVGLEVKHVYKYYSCNSHHSNGSDKTSTLFNIKFGSQLITLNHAVVVYSFNYFSGLKMTSVGRNTLLYNKLIK
jgi:hypothetical protein